MRVSHKRTLTRQLQRGGQYLITVRDGGTNGTNSTTQVIYPGDLNVHQILFAFTPVFASFI